MTFRAYLIKELIGKTQFSCLVPQMGFIFMEYDIEQAWCLKWVLDFIVNNQASVLISVNQKCFVSPNMNQNDK